MSDLQKVGPDWGGTGTFKPFTAGQSGAQRITSGHAIFHDATVAGRVFSFGISNTALVNANAIATGVTSSAQPIIGVWNPLNSNVNLVIWQAIVSTTTVANTAVSPGGFMWVGSASQSAISTGSTPFNQKTLNQLGSQTKAFAVSTALTGLTGSLSVIRASPITTINAAGPATAIHQPCPVTIEKINGSFVVPPGGVLALMGQVATATVSVSSGLVWEEIPYLT